MIVNTNPTVRAISAEIPMVMVELAKAYIQGTIYSHCNNNADKELSVRILFGGKNRNWASPL